MKESSTNVLSAGFESIFYSERIWSYKSDDKTIYEKVSKSAARKMETVLKDLRQHKEKASEIIEAAEKRKEKLLASTHIQAKQNISGIQQQNRQSLEDLKARLETENEERKQGIISEADEVIKVLKQNGEERLGEVVDLLFKTVTNVADE